MFPLSHFSAFAKTLVLACALVLASAHLTASVAQNTPIILITSHDSGPYQEVVASFRHYLEQQQIEGPLLVSSLQTEPAQSQECLSTAQKAGARLILTVGSQATQLALQEVVDVPVIACMIVSAKELGKSANVTGVTINFSIEAQLQRLQDFLPNRKTIGVLYNPAENQAQVEEAHRVARTLGLTILARPVETPQALPEALASLAKDADVLWGLTDQTVLSPQTAEPILLFSFRNRIPFVGLSSSWTKAGALYALDRDYTDLGAQCGAIAVRVLQGTKAGSIPPVPPRKITYSVNLKTAQYMKVDLAPPLLHGAQQVVE
ncbi:MAG: hypothetical protein EXR78_06755 [Deltaproteobacteria bacterium]|nr:hypothetical protein [Deltaproteobacteria bacterium]